MSCQWFYAFSILWRYGNGQSCDDKDSAECERAAFNGQINAVWFHWDACSYRADVG